MSELRIADADREAAASALGEHYAAGRLDQEEYDDVRAQVDAGTWRYTFTELEFSPSRFLADPDGTNAAMKEVLYG